MLKEKKYGLPDASMDLVGDFYTILIGFTMEAAEGDPYDPQGIRTRENMHHAISMYNQ